MQTVQSRQSYKQTREKWKFRVNVRNKVHLMYISSQSLCTAQSNAGAISSLKLVHRDFYQWNTNNKLGKSWHLMWKICTIEWCEFPRIYLRIPLIDLTDFHNIISNGFRTFNSCRNKSALNNITPLTNRDMWIVSFCMQFAN